MIPVFVFRNKYMRSTDSTRCPDPFLFMFEDIPFNTLHGPHQNQNFSVAYRLMMEMLDDPQNFYNRGVTLVELKMNVTYQ